MLGSYVELIRQFVAGEISADEFEDRYIKLWYAALDNLLSQRTPETKIISDLFLEVDAYSNDPETLGDSYCVTADQLRESARQALHELMELQKEHNP
ncbi:MAG: colicin immunity domain-containing protein [Chloroflexota bacterium]